MKTILQTLFFFSLVTQICFAQVNWTKYADNPVFSGQPGTWYAYLSMNCVLYNADSSRYEMWFTAGAQATFPYNIGYAWSDDGISWNVHTLNPVLTQTPGSWDAYMVFDPLVIRENGQYKMWYAGIETTALLTKIGYATSINGINWTKHPDPVLLAGTASWESAAVSYPFVIPYSNGYKMWYSGSSAGASQTAFGYATSSDGIVWQKDTLNNPVLLSGTIGQWDRVIYGPEILYIDNLYYMFYTGQNNLYQSDKVGLATSSDGIHNWNKHISSPVLQPTPGQWDGSRTILGSVFMEDDTLKMYYAGSNGSNWEIGLATSPFVPVSVEDETIQPTEFILEQNFPNPFNSSSVIKYSIPKSSQVTLKIFCTLGEEIETLVNEEKQTGTYEITWHAASLPSGVYFYQLKAGEYVSTKKMLLLK